MTVGLNAAQKTPDEVLCASATYTETFYFQLFLLVTVASFYMALSASLKKGSKD